MRQNLAPGAAPNAERESLLERLRQLEGASRSLDPGANRRKKLRNAVFALSERFLRKIDSVKAYEDTEDKGIGLLDSPISGTWDPNR